MLKRIIIAGLLFPAAGVAETDCSTYENPVAYQECLRLTGKLPKTMMLTRPLPRGHLCDYKGEEFVTVNEAACEIIKVRKDLENETSD